MRRVIALTALLALAGVSSAHAQNVELHPGDVVSIVGNTLPERMQHDGYLETLIHSRFPDHNLTLRNLAFSADELTVQLRSAGFGSPDEHLAKHGTDVIFAFWGFNESFAGDAGIDKFKSDLAGWIDHCREQKYNGESAPRIVLFSPIAYDDETAPGIPDSKGNDARLAKYTAAMKSVANDKKVPFVDLFTPSQKMFADTPGPLTINGIHLTSEGNQLLAPAIDQALFGQRKATSDWSQLEPLRRAVLDKNFYWFHRYRTVDGYSTYGGRSYLKFVNEQTNREVMMRELEVLDVMTANRDKRIWAYAKGKDYKVDDSNAPPFIKVLTNLKGKGPNGEHIFLSGEDAIAHMTVHKNMQVQLVADEKMFPELINPVQMAVDMKGRVWVAAWPSYPHWRPDEEMNDKLLILEDHDGDGRADECKTFVDGLANPTGFEFWNGGVLVAMAPDLLFLKDTDGDDRADVRIRVLHGLDSADTHHTSNSFVIDPGGALYFQEGVFHRTQSETPYGPQRNYDACVWRFEPRTFKFQRYIPYGFANPHGHVFDRWGQGIVHDGTGANPYHDTLISGFLPFPQKHPGAPMVYSRRTRPCPATEILSSAHFPDELQGNLLVGNVIGFQGILQYKLHDTGGSIEGVEVDPILFSNDPNFRPVDLEIGGDGALYFTDWQNPLIGHMQHNLRDPSRDKTHGRVYRVTYKGRDLLKNQPLDTLQIPQLLDKLKDKNNRVRYRARLELSGRKTADVIAATKSWLARLDRSALDFEHHRLEALWLHQSHNVVNADLLKAVLASKDFHARAAAVRVLSYWHDRVPGALALLRTAAADDQPLVRNEAVRAASFLTEPEAVEVPIIAAELATDKYLDYVRTETMKVLEPQWKQAEAAGHKVEFSTAAGRRFMLQNITTTQLLDLPRDEAVYEELIFREGVEQQYRLEALEGLAKLRKTTSLQVLIDTIRNLDENQRSLGAVYDLVRVLTSRTQTELQPVRNQLVEMATSASYPVVRQIGYVALMSADDGIEPAWKLATDSIPSLRDFLNALPLVLDPSFRTALYPRVKALLAQLPPELQGATKGGGAFGRFIRIELPGRRRTLTLAEVQAFSGGKNIAPQGRASQINVASGGVPQRAIDGINSGLYGMNGQTHTRENIRNPWWELDLGEERNIDRIVVWNRREGNLGKRLDGFTLQILDAGRNVVFEKKNIPAPDRSVAFDLEGEGPQGVVRRAAMNALVTVRGYERESFDAVAPFAMKGTDRVQAMRALQRIPRQDWPKDQAKPLADSVLAYLAAIPEADRRNPAAVEALQFGESLAALLPSEEARRVRNELGQLGVQVVRLATLPHRMSFDKERIVVQAGKTVEFIFENPDLMPHNFVVVQPGSLEEIGLLSEANAQKPEYAAQDYIPKSPKIIAHSRLLQPQGSQTLSFEAPKKPGIYPFVCTYPGHWRRMYGALYVVENRQDYLAGPEQYLAAHPMKAADPMLEYLRPRKEWTLSELVASLPDLEHGRSFQNAKQIFTVANCVACHKLNGVGNEVGPDLSKLDPKKYKPADIVRDVLEPSWRIDEKFQSWVFATDSGNVITGLILKETDDAVTILENPLTKTPPKTLKKSEIIDRKKSETSIMPKGLLDRLRRNEILDLLAYVISRGNEKSPLFEMHHH